MTSKLSLAAFASLGLMVAGCLGGYEPATPQQPSAPADPPADPPPVNTPPTTPPPGATPPPVTVTPSSEKPNFVNNVQPILAATCATAACHTAPGASPIRFLPVNAADTYETVIAFSDKLVANTFDKTKAQILLKIAPGHYTATYTPAQVAAIQAWLDGEVVARSAAPVQPNERVKLMSEWSGCMKLTDWNAEGVAVAWANKGTNEGQCKQCHVNAQGWLATEDSTRAFNILTKSPNPRTGGRFMEYYFVPDTTDPAAPKMIINRGMLLRAAGGNAQHPTFNVDGDAMQRLVRFYDKAMAHKAAKTCDPPAFLP
jgi:hypothetical protein